MKSRKTVNIEFLIDQVNSMMIHSVDAAQVERTAVGLFLEKILMEYRCYKGFRYLDEKDMEMSDNGMTVGVRNDVDEQNKWADTDHSRINYLK